MKTNGSRQKIQALTLVETMAVIAVLAFFALLLLPTFNRPHGGQRISCYNNLKQVALSAHLWAGDNNDKFPMEVSLTNGGTMELMNTSAAWKAFQIMSNELSTPKIIFCPEDSLRDRSATNFSGDLKNRISYFIGLDATDRTPGQILCGDDNFLNGGVTVQPGLWLVTSNTPVSWDNSRHVSAVSGRWLFKTKIPWGNIAFADGSVQSLSNSNLLNQFRQSGLATIRLAIP